MKRLKQHWSMRPLSWLLSVAMIWPVLLFTLGSVPAHAQTALNGTPTWAVLDFENHSGYGRDEVGRNASDAFVVELGKSNKYQVLSRQETRQGLANIGLSAPLDVIGLQRLGRDRGVAAVATGEVAAVSFSNNPRQATASVIIRVVDTATGELVNGALSQGHSNGRAIGASDDDALVNEAINNAAFAAVRQITQFNLPKATVLISRDQDSVVVNRGTRDGLFDGLNMVVTRNGSEVGRIRVSDAQADQSNAVVTRRGLGIQPQDKATAIYQLPAYTVAGGALQARNTDVSSDGSSAGHKRNMFSGVTGIILAILAGALLFTLIKRGSSPGSLGGAQVGKPQALEGRADVLGGQGVYPGVQTFGLINGKEVLGLGIAPADYTHVVVRVTATTGNISINDFLEFHVYRSDFPPALQDPSVFAGTTGTALIILPGFGQIPLFSSTGRNSLLVFDDGADKLGETIRKPLLDFGATGGTGGNNTGNGLSTFSTNFLPGSGIQFFGERFQYFVEGLYIQPATDAGSASNPGAPGNTGTTNTSGNGTGTTTGNTTGNTGHPQTFQLTGRTPTNFVTYIIPPLLTTASITSPSGDYGSDAIINVIATPPNITDNVLELSSSPGFTSKYVYTPQQTGSTTDAPFRTTPPFQSTISALGVSTPTDVQRDPNSSPIIWYLRNNQNGSGQDLRLSNLFKKGGPVFARIGTRDPQNGPSATINPYVYSDPVQIPY